MTTVVYEKYGPPGPPFTQLRVSRVLGSLLGSAPDGFYSESSGMRCHTRWPTSRF